MATLDNIYTAVSFFGLALFFLVLMVSWNAIANDANTLWEGSSIGEGIKSDAQGAVNQFDYILFFVYFAFHIGVIITGFLLKTHPFVFVGSIFIIVLLALLAVPLSNAWEDMATNDDLTTSLSSMPKVNFIMMNLPKFEIIWGFLTAIIIFGFSRMGADF